MIAQRRRLSFIRCVVLLAATVSPGFGLHVRGQTPPDFAAGFAKPPDSAQTRTWWHWINGNVTQAGITADLEAMHRVGIHSATIVIVGLGVPDGPVRFGTPEFYDLVKFAAEEAKRLDMSIGIGNCAGWSSSGGSWVKPADSMQNITSSEKTVTGPIRFSDRLAQPPTNRGFYRDVRVVAFPALEDSEIHASDGHPTITASAPHFQDPKYPSGVRLPPVTGRESAYVQYAFARPFTVRSVVIDLAGEESGQCDVQASDDGQAFRPVRSVVMRPHVGPETYALPETTARFFRLVLHQTSPRSKDILLPSVDFRPVAQLDDYLAKTGGIPDRVNNRDFAASSTPTPPDSMIIHLDKMVDLTAKMDASGNLTWDVPPGKWTLLRLGYTSNGMTNHPVTPDGSGLEVNKLNRAAADHYWAGMFGPLTEKLGPLMGSTFDHTLIDSYEVGGQNWSSTFAEDFKQRRGYDLLPYLPIFTGRIVESPAVSDRVLWDVRRTIADLYTDNYYGYFAQLAHGSHLKLEVEPYGDGPFEDIQAGRDGDRVMGEFWWSPTDLHDLGGSAKLAASVAHIYGKTLCGAESFTSVDGGWDMYPANMKVLGDRAFAAGVNSFTFHRYAMQPWLDRWPGMVMGPFGSNLERTVTWWEQGRSWQLYLARCEYMLQQGLFVGDVLFADGEGAPSSAVEPSKEILPAGYDYDTIDTDVLLKLTVKDGQLVLPDGAHYRVLSLDDSKEMSPKLLAKIKELADAGATIIGPKPDHAPGLTGYPTADEQVRKLAEDLWGGGKISDRPLPQTLAELKVPRDFEPADPATKFSYLHRATADADIYFISNQEEVPQESDMLFRVGHRTPWLFHPDTGLIEKVAAWSQDADGRTRIPMHLDPVGSVFVVFHGAEVPEIHPTSMETPPSAGITQDLKIDRAIYGPAEGPDDGQSLDATKLISDHVHNGFISVELDNRLFGQDPAPNVVKHVVIHYVLNGKDFTETLPERALFSVVAPKALFPDARLISNDSGHRVVEARKAGIYRIKMSDGSSKSVEAASVPAAQEVAGSWNVTFPPNWGAPAQATFDKLISWPDSTDAGVKYFSGTATYEKTIAVPSEWLGQGKRLDLDLGDVQAMAEVTLNGKDLGVLWKPPYCVDISSAARAGANELKVAVTNLWPNRIIGDQQLPPDSDRDQNGGIKSWPQWLLDDKPSPTGRLTFASRLHWKKNDPLFPSGLIGPVLLRPAVQITVP